ncbi:MAG: N-acetylmuramoyl-L-alanine amidase [Candidatus Paceibacterota bacterium]
MQTDKKSIFVFVGIILFSGIVFSIAHFPATENIKNSAAIFFVDSKTVDGLKNSYQKAGFGNPKMKILIVPGHDDSSWGTKYQGIKEADLNLEMAKYLASFLKNDQKFDVILARDDSDYNPLIENYFASQRKGIENFVINQKKSTKALIDTGYIEENSDNIIHNTAAPDVALRLYAINKWASENGVDVVIHAHFNDYPRRSMNVEGKYSGFVIYVPEDQLSNAKASQALAGSVYEKLSKFYAESDLKSEQGGIIKDQTLIAVGAKNTLDSAAILIEYGYIYESQFLDNALRPIVFKDMALKTYSGIESFFGGTAVGLNRFGSSILPYNFNSSIKKGAENDGRVLALQVALASEGVYPPVGKSKNDCPINGNYKNCTEKSLNAFQEKYNIKGEDGNLGPKTVQKLNELYGNQ